MRTECPTLTRCCFCMPLRIGLLVFGYLNLAMSVLMLVSFCIVVNKDRDQAMLHFNGAVTVLAPAEMCLVVYLCEIIFTGLFLFGLHQKAVKYIKMFYYYSMAITVGTVLLQIVELFMMQYIYLEMIIVPLMLLSLFVRVYLLVLMRSVMQKVRAASPAQGYHNALHWEVVVGDCEMPPPTSRAALPL